MTGVASEQKILKSYSRRAPDLISIKDSVLRSLLLESSKTLNLTHSPLLLSQVMGRLASQRHRFALLSICNEAPSGMRCALETKMVMCSVMEEREALVRQQLKTMTVGFIGAGRMAQAMAKAFVAAEIVTPNNMRASDTMPQMLNIIKKFGVNTTSDNKEVVKNSNLIVLAVKPNIVAPVLQEVSEVMTRDKLIVSIAAGVTLNTLEQNLPRNTRVVRVMPNTPALVQEGASVLAPGSSASDDDKALVCSLFKCLGICEVGTEDQLDAVTGVSGSGPAYGFVAIEALADGGVLMGLPRDLSQRLAAQALLGAAKMVLETGKHPGQLKDEVCSPGGTSIAAMKKLERGGFRANLIEAVEACNITCS
ncbi:hypothetical protein FSP39_003266 [Pinctada imbricata]|uniref:pyrroline-5-carboxylate reductase n=1 Tax=Pinctada imbricata TaxID=66713 RepID=A0AA88XKR0_PINIB|nr:hypothetical protein FSP39_003266 [Pinctada imbricata]